MILRYFFDVVCPYSYIMGFEVEEAEDEDGIEVEWLPFELRPAPAPLPEPRGEYIRGHWRGQVYGLAGRHGVEIHVPRYQPRSTLALTLHGFAVKQGKGRPFRNAVHRAFFVEGLDISDDAVLREAAREAGLDADAALEAAWDPTGLAALRSAREEALRLGVHGVPTVAAAEDVLFYGAAEPGRLRHMLVKESGAR